MPMTSTLLNGWAPSVLESGPRSSSVTIGTPWHSQQDGTITTIRWYCTRAVTSGVPTAIRVVNRTIGAQVYTSGALSTPGATGWQAITGLGIPVSAGHAHWLLWDLPVGNFYGEALTGAFPGADVPLVVETPSLNYHSPAPSSSLELTISGVLELLDFDFEPTGGGGGGVPATTGDVGIELARWLRDDAENSHKPGDTLPGLPATTKVAVDALQAQANGASGFDAIKAVADAVASAVGGLAGTIATAVTTITGQVTASSADIFSHAVTGLVAISGDVRSVENHALDVLAGNVTFPGGSAHWQWVAGDPIGFAECVAVAVGADAYHLEILEHPRIPLNEVCGVHVLFRSGWWCELTGGVASERHFVDFEETLLRDGARRLSGCLVSLQPGATGVVTPYTLEPV